MNWLKSAGFIGALLLGWGSISAVPASAQSNLPGPSASPMMGMPMAKPMPQANTSVMAALPTGGAQDENYKLGSGDKLRLTILMGNRQDELAWWQQQKAKDGYKTWSGSIAPGISSLAFWIAQQVLDGKKVPHDMIVPYLSFTQDNFEAALRTIPKGGVASHEYSQADAVAAIKANTK